MKLPHRIRVSRKAHFDYIFSHSKRRENDVVRVYVASAYDVLGKSAFVASRKVGNAVVRNQCKRRLKEIFRMVLPRLKQDVDVVMVAKTRLIGVTFEEASQRLIRIFRDLGIVEAMV